MTEVIEKLTEGDIFRWSYNDQNVDPRTWGTYHCCSRIAVVQDGRLHDTYWCIFSKERGKWLTGGSGRSFGLEDIARLDLTRLANHADLQSAREYDADYYDDADIVDLNHPNCSGGHFFLRKGAKRSQKKMLVVARRKLERSISEEKSAAYRSEKLRESIAQIEDGKLDGFI